MVREETGVAAACRVVGVVHTVSILSFVCTWIGAWGCPVEGIRGPLVGGELDGGGAGFFASAKAAWESGRSSWDLTTQPITATARTPSIANKMVFIIMEGRPPCRPISLFQWAVTAQPLDGEKANWHRRESGASRMVLCFSCHRGTARKQGFIREPPCRRRRDDRHSCRQGRRLPPRGAWE